MSVMEWRGGFPVVFRMVTVPTATVTHVELGAHMPRSAPASTKGTVGRHTCKYLRIQNHDTTNFLRVYFSLVHATADEHFIVVPEGTAEMPVGVWEGPVEAKELWMRADTGNIAAVDITSFVRRG